MDQTILQFIKDDIAEIKTALKEQDAKIDSLLEFKWKIVGGAFLASVIITSLFQLFLVIVKK